jgi:hypothetical protein
MKYKLRFYFSLKASNKVTLQNTKTEELNRSIEIEENLSQEGYSCISLAAQACRDAVVYGNAELYRTAIVGYKS